MTSIDTLPDSWVCVTLEEVARLNPPKPTLEDDEEVTFLPMALVEEESGKYYLTDTRKYGEVKKGYTGFTEGDVIFAKITPCMENGKVALLSKLTNSVGFGSTEFHVVRPSVAVDGKFLFHFLVRRTFRGVAQRNMTGSAGQLRVPKGFLSEAKIPIAPLPEQRAIVAKIEQLFSEMDNGISNLKTALEQLKVYRQAVLKKAFEGELTKAWRAKQKDLPTAEELLEQIRFERENYHKRQIEDWQERLTAWEKSAKEGKKPSKPKNPEDNQDAHHVDLDEVNEYWICIKLEYISEFITDGDHNPPKRIEKGIPHLTAKNIRQGIIDETGCSFISTQDFEKVKKRYFPKHEDVLLTCVGTLGRTALVPLGYTFSADRNIAAIRLLSAVCSAKYVKYFLSTYKIQNLISQASGYTAQPHLYLQDIRKFNIPFCSLAEQHQIIQEIESRLSVCDKLEETIKDSLEKAEALRQSILKKAFEGKLLTEQELEACRQQPDWEPAEKLLERIKKEGGKAARKTKKAQTAEVL